MPSTMLPSTTTMTTTRDDSFSICDRLTWVRYNNLWWPGVKYESYGELLSRLDRTISFKTKCALCQAVVRTKNQTSIVRLVNNDNNNMTLLETASTQDFYTYFGDMVEQGTEERYCHHYESFQRAMRLTLQYMKNEVNDSDNDQIEVQEEINHDRLLTRIPETPPSVAASSTPAIVGTPIHSNDSWDDAWDKMLHSGWRICLHPSNDGEYCYIQPGASLKKGKEGVDYFTSLSQVQDYAKQHYSWEGEEESSLVLQDEGGYSSSNSQEEEGEDKSVVPSSTEKPQKPPAHKSRKRSPDSEEESCYNNSQEESSVVQHRTKKTTKRKPPVRITTSKKRKAADKGRVWGREKKRRTASSRRHSSSSKNTEFYEWPILFPYLKSIGWKAVKARNPLHDWYYVCPGKTVKNGELGKDYFASTVDVIVYARSKNLHLQASPASSLSSQGDEASPAASTSPLSLEEVSSVASRSRQDSVTPDCKPQPQDPGIPLLSEEEESSDNDEDPYFWPVLWPRLKQSGWIAVKATGLYNWYYVRPGRSVKGGTLGVDYFCTEDDVVAHEREADERDDKDYHHSPLGLELEQEATAACVPPQRRQIQYSSPPKQRLQWWRTEPVPNFTRHVWPVLRDKMGYRYTCGKYVLPNKSGMFVAEKDMSIYMCKNGVPNMDMVNEEERETLRRWVTFSHLHVTDQNSISRLESVPLLSSKDAWEILSTKLGYKQVLGKYIPPWAELLPGYETQVSGRHYFDTLDHLQCFLRASEMLDGSDEVQGRSSRKRDAKKLSVDQDLALRLWAATSPAPLPEHALDMEESGSNVKDQLMTQPCEESSNSSSEKNDDNEATRSTSGENSQLMTQEAKGHGQVEQEDPALSPPNASSRRVNMDPFEFTGSDSPDKQTQKPVTTPRISETMGIHRDDEWHDVWRKMRNHGWSWIPGKGIVDYVYIMPGAKRPGHGGELNVDFFHEEERVKEYAKTHYGWGGDEEHQAYLHHWRKSMSA